MNFYELPDGGYFVKKGTPLPLCCPKCRKPVPIGENREQALIALARPLTKCPMCDYEGPTDEFLEVEWEFTPRKIN